MCFGRITDTEPETRDTSCSSAIQITPFVPIKIDLLKTWRFSNFHFHYCLSSYLLTDLAWHLNPISINKFLLRILMLMCRIFLVNKCFVRFSVFFFHLYVCHFIKTKTKARKKAEPTGSKSCLLCFKSVYFILFSAG